jgi:hypothetical protein
MEENVLGKKKEEDPMRSRPLSVSVAAILQVILNGLNFPGPG